MFIPPPDAKAASHSNLPIQPKASEQQAIEPASLLPGELQPTHHPPPSSALIRSNSYIRVLQNLPKPAAALIFLGLVTSIGGATGLLVKIVDRLSPGKGNRILLLSTAVLLISGLALALRELRKPSVEQSIDQIVQRFNKSDAVRVLRFERNSTHRIVNEFIASAQVPIETVLARMSKAVNQESAKAHLLKRFQDIFSNQRTSPEEKRMACLNVLNDFENNINTLMQRCKNDQAEISTTFFSGQKATLTKITVINQETHHRGQVPLILTFNVNGISRQIMYKPRDIRMDAFICGRTNSLFMLVGANMPTYNFLPQGDTQGYYGFVEYITHTTQDYTLTPEEMRDYYRTIGKIQALAQIFGIYDLHQGNVIVHNKLPHLVDLETSFIPRTVDQQRSTNLEDAVVETEIAESTPSQNRVLRREANTVISMEEHLRLHREQYLGFISEGYEEVINLCSKHPDRFLRFVDSLPGDLRVRFVSMSTSILDIWLEGLSPSSTTPQPDAPLQDYREGTAPLARTVLQAGHQIVSRLQQMHHMNQPVAEASRKLETEQLREDLSHRDVPVMQMDLQGNIFHNNQLILKTNQDIGALLKARIRNPGFLFTEFKRTVTPKAS